ncbi:hypothetical protein V6615_11675 [Oscillospiraceae bacterium PP1C4]
MKRFFALAMAAILALSLASISVLAAVTVDMPYGDNVKAAYDEDGGTISAVTASPGKVVGDYVNPGKKLYIELPADTTTVTGLANATVGELCDSDDFSFKLDRDKNGKYLSSVKFVNKKLYGTDRKNYIEVLIKDSTITEDVKVTFDVYFKARNSKTGKWDSGDIVNTRFELWVNNDTEDGNDATIGTGEGKVFNPTSNETNIITWGNDYEVASLKFTANSDADKFYAKLSTKADNNIYSEYGDPADADLYFRTFVGSPSIDSTSRATLTFYNPWNENYDNDYDYSVDPRDCYIYTIDSDGYLEDVTDRFTYVDEDDTDAGIDGWQTKVRTLGKYVISDTKLDVGNETEISEEPESPSSKTPPVPLQPGTPVRPPETGSHDMLAGAAVLAVVSCAAIGFARRRK